MTDGKIDRVAHVLAINELQELKHRYAAACDDGYDAGLISAMFVEDGIWDGDKWGTHIGRSAIHDYFSGMAEQFPWSLHYVTNQVLSVDPSGLEARGAWYLWMPATLRNGDEDVPVILTGTYKDRFQYVNGAWLFTELRLTPHHLSPLQVGWVDQPFFGADASRAGSGAEKQSVKR